MTTYTRECTRTYACPFAHTLLNVCTHANRSRHTYTFRHTYTYAHKYIPQQPYKSSSTHIIFLYFQRDTNIVVCINIHTRLNMHVCKPICTFPSTHIRAHAQNKFAEKNICIRTNMHTYIYTHAFSCTSIKPYPRLPVHTHTLIHTRAHIVTYS